MTVRENLIAVLNGETPESTPYYTNTWNFTAAGQKYDEWQHLFDQGLGISLGCQTVVPQEQGVRSTLEQRLEGDRLYRIRRKETPIGTIQSITVDSVSKPRAIEWTIEYWIKEPRDHRIRQWIVEHTELVPQYDAFEKTEERAGDNGVTTVSGGRTPAMSILVDYAGMERFALDVALEVEDLFELYEAHKRLFLERTHLVAEGPGRFVGWSENLTAGMMGRKRYDDLLLPIYNEAGAALEAGGKRVMVHFDGQLSAVAESIGNSGFHILQSLTEPPEGDMTLDACRASWPDKSLWVNVNLGLYNLPEAEMREAIIGMRERAGKKGLALAISEDVPKNWATTVPVILQTLRELG